MENLLLPLLLLGAFWLLMIRPQQQRVKKQREMIDALAPGDQIVTIGGIFGSIVEVGERVRVRVVDGSEMEFAKEAVARVIPSEDSTEEADGTEGEANGS